jgi:hemolysin III
MKSMAKDKNPSYHLAEELASCITHGIGTLLSIVGLTLLVIFAAAGGDPWRVVSVSIFGATLVLMYLTSTLYHACTHTPARNILQICDHCSIYLLIAGTYTPFLLVNMRGPWGWSLFGVLWGMAVAGCAFKIWMMDHNHKRWWNFLSNFIYIAMGWAVIIALKSALETVNTTGIILLIVGGVAYTGGVIFFCWQRLPYNHTIWHLFVLSGSVSHFFAVFFFVVPLAATAG